MTVYAIAVKGLYVIFLYLVKLGTVLYYNTLISWIFLFQLRQRGRRDGVHHHQWSEGARGQLLRQQASRSTHVQRALHDRRVSGPPLVPGGQRVQGHLQVCHG